MGDRILGVAVMGEAADEADALRDAVAFAAADDRSSRRRRAEIVDPEVERRLRPEVAELDPDRQAGRHVHQADDRARGDDPGLRHADQLLVIGQAQLGPVVAMGVVGDAERAAMADAPDVGHEPRGIERAGAARIAHAASRSAVSRISAIMLGIPWVRLELSWLRRSNRASSPSMSRARISSGVRSCTASRIRATIPLVIAALLSARKWSRPSSRGTG